MKRIYALMVATAIAVVALVVRWPAAGTFMTADEENWMVRSGEYYHKLFRNHDPSGTYITSHPGATGMWLMGAGIALQEQRLNIDIDTSNVQQFRRAATLPVALATSILVGIITYELVLIAGGIGGLSAGALLAFDPYLVGLGQIAHLDALLASFMLSSVLAGILWWKYGKKYWLVVAGIAGGLALGTKLLPALWLFVWFSGLLGYRLLLKRIHWTAAVRTLGMVVGVAALTFVAIWPAAWAQPNVNRAFEKDVPTIVGDAHVEFELAKDPINPQTFYARTVAGRTLPTVFVLTSALIIFEVWRTYKTKKLSTTGALLLYAIGYLILISFIAKKGDRYALPALSTLPVIVGLGVASLGKYYNIKDWKIRTAYAVLVGVSIFTVLSWTPHAIAYASPLFPQNIRPYSQQGWGEGLEEAAAWLNQSPFIDRLYVASWYPDVLGTYFKGKALSLSSRDDKRVGYIVAYRNMGGRAQDDIASNVLDELQDKQPIHTISIHGVPYVWIYNNLGPYYFRRHVGELAGNVEVGQVIPIVKSNWNAIDIAVATFSSRNNTEDVVLEVWSDIDDTEPIRTSIVNASQMKDEEFQRFAFDPIPDSAGHTFYVSLRSPASHAGNAITVRYTDEDVSPGVLVLRRNPLQAGEKRSNFIRTGDIGYQIP